MASIPNGQPPLPRISTIVTNSRKYRDREELTLEASGMAEVVDLTTMPVEEVVGTASTVKSLVTCPRIALNLREKGGSVVDSEGVAAVPPGMTEI